MLRSVFPAMKHFSTQSRCPYVSSELRRALHRGNARKEPRTLELMGNATLFRTRRSNLNASLPRRRASALPFTASRNCFTAKTAMKKSLTGRRGTRSAPPSRGSTACGRSSASRTSPRETRSARSRRRRRSGSSYVRVLLPPERRYRPPCGTSLTHSYSPATEPLPRRPHIHSEKLRLTQEQPARPVQRPPPGPFRPEDVPPPLHEKEAREAARGAPRARTTPTRGPRPPAPPCDPLAVSSTVCAPVPAAASGPYPSSASVGFRSSGFPRPPLPTSGLSRSSPVPHRPITGKRRPDNEPSEHLLRVRL